jgi:hypothetical protein
MTKRPMPKGAICSKIEVKDKTINSMVCIGDRIYWRDIESESTSMHVINKHTMQFVEHQQDHQMNIRNNIIRDFEKDDWNKPLLEVSNKQKLDKLTTKEGLYRVIDSTPLFTNGTHLWVIVKYVQFSQKEQNQEEEAKLKEKKKQKNKPKANERTKESEKGNNDQYNFTVVRYEVEMYDSETWEFVKSIQLYFEPENIEIERNEMDRTMSKLDFEELRQIKEDISQLKLTINCQEEAEVIWWINNNILIMIESEKFHFFDMKTGRRFKETIDISEEIDPNCSTVLYNYSTNVFWYLNSNDKDYPQLKSFSINGFGEVTNKIVKNKLEFQNFQKKMITKIIESQSENTKIEPMTEKSLLTSLIWR